LRRPPTSTLFPYTPLFRSDVLLLDEPTNHLDLTTIEWLEGELRQIRSAIVLISHDRRFLENVSRATVWLDRGITRRLEQGFGHLDRKSTRLNSSHVKISYA